MKVNVSFTVEIPTDAATRDDIWEWIRFELGARGNMSGTNSLNFIDLQSCAVKDVCIS
jgi:hypothetical protein